MPTQITVTSKTGPGSTVTGLVLTNVQSINLDFAKKVATVTTDLNPPREFDLAATTTLTCTITVGANGTLVLSQ